MATLSLRNVRKSYGAHDVIHGLDLDIGDTDFVALVGPSGCGKSTLLRMIAGLEELSGGEIYIGEENVGEKMPKDRDIAMVFQSYALYPHMTVRENMSFALNLRKMPKVEVNRAVEEAAEILGLTELLERRPKDLSGGQRQRVAMGRAIVRSPKVFLFDEPLSNLDAKLRVTMRAEVIKLHQKLETTSVYVTHDQVEAMTMADRIVVMRAGRIEQVGAPLELYDYPENVFVAQFIGTPTMNIVQGDVRDGRLSLFGGTCALEMEGQVPDGPLLVGIRPEHIEVRAPGEGGVAATLDLVEPMGNETMTSCTIGDTAVQTCGTRRIAWHHGSPVSLEFDPEKLHFFDPQTEIRLGHIARRVTAGVV
ncbi:ABC transporter ATP-binding protein [Martelella sp. AMO21009]